MCTSVLCMGILTFVPHLGGIEGSAWRLSQGQRMWALSVKMTVVPRLTISFQYCLLLLVATPATTEPSLTSAL